MLNISLRLSAKGILFACKLKLSYLKTCQHLAKLHFNCKNLGQFHVVETLIVLSEGRNGNTFIIRFSGSEI